MNTVKIGLFGFGVVGEGIYQVLSQKQQLKTEIKRVVIQDGLKPRNAPPELFSTCPEDILNDHEIDLVVELIDDSDTAFKIATTAMMRGQSVISANKKMIAEHHLELIHLSARQGVAFLYEAAVAGSIPIIRNLEDYFGADELTQVRGIVNGSTNFILSKMHRDQCDYHRALQEAQKNGFAESDPTNDVEGIDAAFKLSILAVHSLGKVVNPKHILRKGITSLHPDDFEYARSRRMVIKLIAKCKSENNVNKIGLSVLPTFISSTTTLGNTHDEFNVLVLDSSLAHEQYFYGKGAGRFPTALAVLNDIRGYLSGYRYRYNKGIKASDVPLSESIRIYCSYHRGYSLDSNLIDNISERHIEGNREYVIGTVLLRALQTSGILNNKDISVIAFDP